MKKQIFLASLIVSLSVPLVSSAATLATNFPRNLTLGTKGEDVSRLQQFLTKDTSIYPEGLVTGYFGSLTQKAVVRFQQKNNITPTRGYVGPLTRAKLEVLAGATLSDSVTPSQNGTDLISLLKQLADLKAQILAMQQTTTEAATTTIATTTPLIASVTPPTASNTITVSGGSTSPLAESAKIGDVAFTNNSTSSAILFHINVTMDESLDAPHSRGVTFKLTMRNGTSTYDTVLEKKDVAIRTRDPDPGPYNSQLLTFYAGITIPPGESKSLSLWSELLVGPFYSGLLRFTITSVSTIPELTSVGTAVLTLSP